MLSTSPSTTSLAPSRAERVRLMRSARKVQSILGEIPILTDLAAESSSSNGATTNLSTCAFGEPPSTARPILFIQLSSTGTSNPNPHHSPASPTTPLLANAQEDAARRRKMAKLSRTLGENIPPELVFSSGAPAIFRRPRRASSLSVFGLNASV
ncbi:hypothetical protein C8F04DRAFT_1107224 [Mycena alexandri]|uniref:Uncharacterized protein n=1 Tax=Mycena alexandri TaxID=1745969 RepID=A0AAD6ST06_9AGAR|nr:hypothetical protein C8F04DRAFT_1107224 [Mycena alexandri]